MPSSIGYQFESTRAEIDGDALQQFTSMFPFFLHREKAFAIARRRGLLHSRQRLLEFFTRMSDQCFQRALIGHRDYPALNSTTQKLATQIPSGRIVEFRDCLSSAGSAIRYRGNNLRQRLEFDKAVDRESDRAPVFHETVEGVTSA